MSRRNVRILAIGLIAVPEPLLSTPLGLLLLGVSFLLPDLEDGEGRACTCGCDYHRRRVARDNPAVGAGALIQVRRLVMPRMPSSSPGHVEAFGFGPVLVPGEPAGSLRNATVSGCESPSYAWHQWPKYEGALLRRLSGFGGRTAVKFELKRNRSLSRA
jgi:hypothetical protein